MWAREATVRVRRQPEQVDASVLGATVRSLGAPLPPLPRSTIPGAHLTASNHVPGGDPTPLRSQGVRTGRAFAQVIPEGVGPVKGLARTGGHGRTSAAADGALPEREV